MAAPPLPAEQIALLRAVVAAPDEDTPRLAYADWLDEHGDGVQAAFVRYQVAKERDPLDPALAEMARRDPWRQWADPEGYGEFHDATARGWLKALGCRHAWGPGLYPGFRRGCVETISAEGGLDKVLDDAPVLFNLQPVRLMSVFTEYPDTHEGPVLRLAAAPEFARLRGLIFDGYHGSPAAYRALFHSRYAAGLRTLILHELDLTDEDAEALADSPTLTGLRRLDLIGHQITPRGARALARSPGLAGVTHLGFARNFGDGGYEPLTAGEEAALGELRERFGAGLILDELPRPFEGYYSAGRTDLGDEDRDDD